MENFNILLDKKYKKNNIDFDLQKKLRDFVKIEDSLYFENKKIFFEINSDIGIVYLDEGINKYHYSGYIKNNRNIRLFYQYWLIDPFRPTIFFLHGNAENSSSHPLFFFYLLKKGFNILTFDQEGYGSSDGIRGTIVNADYYFENIELIYKFFYNKLLLLRKGAVNIKKNDEINYPEFIFIGFSMGGFEVIYFYLIYFYNKTKENKNELKFFNSIKTIILLCPWLNTHKRITNPFILKFLKYLYKIFNPYILMSQETQRMILSKDENFYIELYKNLTDNYEYLKRRFKDTRIHRLRSMRWLSNITKCQHELYKFIKKICKNKDKESFIKLLQNIYIFIGEKDIIVDNERTLNISKLISNITKSSNIFVLKDYFHDFLDYDKEKLEPFFSKLDQIFVNFIKN